MSDQLTAKEAATLAGVQPSTWDAYVTRGHAPEPDGRLGNQRWWYRSTIEQWMRGRLGRGARTDLQEEPSGGTRLVRGGRGRSTIHLRGCPHASQASPWHWAEPRSTAAVAAAVATYGLRACKVCKPLEQP